MKLIHTAIIGTALTLAASGVSFAAQAPAANTTNPAPVTKKHAKKHTKHTTGNTAGNTAKPATPAK